MRGVSSAESRKRRKKHSEGVDEWTLVYGIKIDMAREREINSVGIFANANEIVFTNQAGYRMFDPLLVNNLSLKNNHVFKR